VSRACGALGAFFAAVITPWYGAERIPCSSCQLYAAKPLSPHLLLPHRLLPLPPLRHSPPLLPLSGQQSAADYSPPAALLALSGRRWGRWVYPECCYLRPPTDGGSDCGWGDTDCGTPQPGPSPPPGPNPTTMNTLQMQLYTIGSCSDGGLEIVRSSLR
jgi:hypothetical protein